MDWQHTREDLLRNPDVQRMIAERAYLISQSRGFEGGHEMEDWLRAEHEIIDYLQREHEARITEPHAAEALALVESAIHEEPVSRPLASEMNPASADELVPVKKKATKKRETKTAAPKAKTASTKTSESKSVKATAGSKPKPILKKASKKPTGASPSSETGD